MTDIYVSNTPEDTITPEELSLYHEIMAYRATNGLAPIPLSSGLSTTAGRHALDTRDNIWEAGLTLPSGANLHSWSDAPYFSDHSAPEAMWHAPQRLNTSYTGTGYEISAAGYESPSAALTGWQGSPGHNTVILNQSIWSGLTWNAIGVGVISETDFELNYAGRVYHVWFGAEADPGGPPLIEGTQARDTLLGTLFADSVASGDSNDNISGQDGDDTLFGGSQNDTLFGGAGNDSLSGDTGADLLSGGTGDDTADGGQGHDTIYGGDGRDTLIGGTGNDRLFGNRHNDYIAAGDGNDTVDGGFFNDTIAGGNGQDSLMGNRGTDLIFGGAGHDILSGGDSADTLSGGTGRDTLNGDGGNDQLLGGVQNDVLNGGAAADVLFGNQGNDTLSGGTGRDTLHGGSGNDQLTGGSDQDQFVFLTAAGNNVITDFQNGTDRIDLSALNLAGFAALNGAISAQNGGALIDLGTLGGSGSIWLQNTATGLLDASDFVF